jgi:hypothetical protein
MYLHGIVAAQRWPADKEEFRNQARNPHPHRTRDADYRYRPRGIAAAAATARYRLNNSRSRFVCARLTGISVLFLSFIRS